MTRFGTDLFERMNKMKSKTVIVGLAMALVLAIGSQASATPIAPFDLTDGDSTVVINPTSSAGMTSWTIGNTNYLKQQWFWFRTNLDGVYDDKEYSIDAIDAAPTVDKPTLDIATVTYADTNIEVQVTYNLTDEPGPLGGSNLTETVLVTNLTDHLMTLTFFQYSDFELGGDPTDTDLDIPNGNEAIQKDTTKAALMSETIVTGAGLDHLVTSEVGYDSTTLDKLIDGVVDVDLDGSTLLTVDGDMTWAFEWRKQLVPGDALLLSKVKHISIAPGGGQVPEPAGLGLVGLALLAVARRKRK